MSQLLARYLLMSDAHWMVVPPEEQKGIVIKGFDRLWDRFIFRRQKRRNNLNFCLTLLEAKEQGPFDQLIFTGDLVECEYNERGITTSTDIAGVVALEQLILFTLDINADKFHSVPGDHESGYDLPIKADLKGGMRLESLENFKKILGPLWSAWEIGNFHFITISSSLFIQHTKHLKREELMEIDFLKYEQEKFLAEYLFHVYAGKKVFLFLHDADAMEIIDQFPGAEKITKVFCGHFHRERNLKGYRKLGKAANSFWGRMFLRVILGIQNRLERANRIITWAKGNPRRLELFEKYDLMYIPSVAETKSFLVLELYGGGEYEIQKFMV